MAMMMRVKRWADDGWTDMTERRRFEEDNKIRIALRIRCAEVHPVALGNCWSMNEHKNYI